MWYAVVLRLVRPGCHTGWQVNDLWKCKYCHSTVINAPAWREATCIFMMSHKHCPYVTPAGKCVPRHATHLPPSGAPMARSAKWRDVKENASLCQTQRGEFHLGLNQEKKHPLICPGGYYSQTQKSDRSLAISSCFDFGRPLMGSKVRVGAVGPAAVKYQPS